MAKVGAAGHTWPYRGAVGGATAIVALLLVATWHGGGFSPTSAPPRLSLVVLAFET